MTSYLPADLLTVPVITSHQVTSEVDFGSTTVVGHDDVNLVAQLNQQLDVLNPPSYSISTVLGWETELVLTGESLVGTAGPPGPTGPPSMLVLFVGQPIPPGTLPGTIIFRR